MSFDVMLNTPPLPPLTVTEQFLQERINIMVALCEELKNNKPLLRDRITYHVGYVRGYCDAQGWAVPAYIESYLVQIGS